MLMKKTKYFICFKMLKEGFKLLKLFFWASKLKTNVTRMYKISCLHPILGILGLHVTF
jgi:hypothetical protein